MAVTILPITSEDRQLLADAINDIRLNAIGPGAKYHIAVGPLPTATIATNLSTAITLVNDLRAIYEGSTSFGHYLGHRNDAPGYTANGMTGLIHLARDTANDVTAPVATSQATADTLADDLKAQFNAHLAQAGVHFNDDVTNTVTAGGSDGTSGTLVTLVNDIRAKMLLHIGDALGGTAYRAVSR